MRNASVASQEVIQERYQRVIGTRPAMQEALYLARTGAFREHLYYRLNVVTIPTWSNPPCLKAKGVLVFKTIPPS